MRSIPGFGDFFFYRLGRLWICSANRWLGVEEFSCETGRQISSALFRIRRRALPERLLHVEQFAHFDSFLRFCAFLS
jgi:hypothetical protein